MPIRQATAPELAYLSADNQHSVLHLAFTENPPVVYTCRVDQTFATHDMVAQITFDGGSGTLADVLPGMTVWVGTAAGLYDVGMTRVRKDPIAGTLYLGESSEIDWANDLYITIVDEMLLWPKHVRIVNTEAFMDYDIDYDDQHTNFEPVPIMGCNAVLDVVDYPVTVKFPEADRSWVFDSTITAWLWEATEGVVTNETTDDPTLTISSYPTNGQIRVSLTLTTAAGKTFTGYRYVKVYDHEQDEDDLFIHRPVDVFQLESCSGSYSAGDWEFDVSVYTDATTAEIRDRAPVILFADDYYGDDEADKISIGQLTGRENIVAMGWVDAETIVYNPEAGTVKFSVRGGAYWMDKMNAYPSGVRLAKTTPAKWTDMTALTVDRGLFHFLHHRSTLTAVSDVTLTGDTRIASEMSSPSSSLWGQIKQMAETSIFALGGFDQYCRLFVFIEPQVTPIGERSWETVMDVTEGTWMNEVSIDRKTVSELSLLYLSGISVDATGSPATYYSLSPGHVFKKFGSVENKEKLLLTDQSQSNSLAGYFAGWKNNPYPNLQIKFAQNNRMFTLFPQQFARFETVPSDTERGVELGLNLIPRSISYEWDDDSGLLSTEITFEAETFEALNTNGDVPGIISSGSISKPPKGRKVTPPIPAIVLPPSEANPNIPSDILIWSSTHGVMYTRNAEIAGTDPSAVEWVSMNAGLSTLQAHNIDNLVVTPGGQLYCVSLNEVFRCDGLGGSWYLVASPETGRLIMDIAVNTNEDDAVGVISVGASGVGATGDFKLLQDGTLSGILATLQIRGPWRASLSFTGDKYYGFSSGNGVLATPTCTILTSSGSLAGQIYWGVVGSDAYSRWSNPLGSSGEVAVWDESGAADTITYFLDGAVDHADTLFNVVNARQGLSFSPTGNYGMGSSLPAATCYWTSDRGATWLLTALTIGPTVWESCKDDYRWVYGGGANIRITLDRGATNYNLFGNLIYSAPLIGITGIRYIAE